MSHPEPAEHPRTSGPRPRRRRAATALGLAVSIPLTAAPAMAAVTPVELPHSIEVFPNIDMAGAAGFTEPFVLQVWRNGVMVGSTGAPVASDLFEVNHAGPPCWSGSTPDIIPGDQLRVINADTLDLPESEQVGEYMTAANIDAEPAKLVALDSDGIRNDVVMTGTATTLDGTAALELSHLSAEIVQPAWRDNGWRGRALGAVPGGALPNATTPFPDRGDGVLFYDAVSSTNPLGNHWTAVWKNMPQPHANLALEGEHTVAYFERDDGVEGSGLTIMDAEDVSGAVAGCPAAASDAVNGTVPAAANIAFVEGDTAMKVSGTAYNAASVRVTLDDNDGTSADAVTVNGVLSNPASTAETAAPVAPVRQTWSASFPNAAFDALADGDLTVSAQFQRVIEEREERTVTTTEEVPVIDPVTNEPAVDPVTNEVVTETVVHEETTTVYTHDTTAMPGRDHALVKDTVAPLAPTAFPAPGRYATAQSITVTPEDEMGDVVRYRTGDGTQADPTAGSPIAPAPYLVSNTQTIKARSFDGAGNGSATATLAYQIVPLTVPSAATIGTTTAGDGSATVSWTPPANDGGTELTGYNVRVLQGGTLLRTERFDADITSAVISGLTNGLDYTFRVAAINSVGTGAYSAASAVTSPVGVAVDVPGVATDVTAVEGNARATVTWTAPEDDGGAAISEYRVQIRTGTTVVRTITGLPGTASSAVATGLTNGTAYNFRVRALNSAGAGSWSSASAPVTPRAPVVLTAPGQPAAPTATAGAAGGALTASAAWVPPTSNGGTPVTGYVVRALRINGAGTVIATTTSAVLPASARTFSMTLPNGNYRFTVQAQNSVGSSVQSARSNLVAAR